MTTYADLQLDLSPLAEVTYEPELSLADRFAAFHKANPHVADVLEALVSEWLAAGHHKVGMKAVAERARWESGVRSTGEPWAINNSFVSFYSRLMIERHPIWAEYIETRRAVADSP